MQKVIVICGPTASGKTALSIELAKRINGEVVSADSMQIYDEMSIGTAKPDEEEMQGIKHYLIGNVSPTNRYSVSDYKSDAMNAIEEIINKNKMPIVVGGTGLYVNSLIYGIDYPEVKTDLEYREELEKIAKKDGLKHLYEKAMQIDPEAAKNISENDKKRIIRILEIYKETGKTKTQLEIESRKNGVPYDYRVFAINMPREILYDRINRRVDIMIERGLIDEVKQLYEKYGEELRTAVQGIGYKEVIDYLNGVYSKEEMVEKIKMETRRYAKRQLTWFRKIQDIIWIDGLNDIQNNADIILEEIKSEKH
jgi:tRNA dimethylallyltransferase